MGKHECERILLRRNLMHSVDELVRPRWALIASDACLPIVKIGRARVEVPPFNYEASIDAFGRMIVYSGTFYEIAERAETSADAVMAFNAARDDRRVS